MATTLERVDLVPRDESARASETSWRSRFLRQLEFWERYGPATLLVVVAATHFYLVKVADLTQWKGGGFGMFSTVDAQRVARIDLYDERGLRFRARLPDDTDFRRAFTLVRRLPTSSNVEQIAGELARSVWLSSPSGAARLGDPASADGAGWSEPRAEFPWKLLDGRAVSRGRELERLEPWEAGDGARGRLRLVSAVDVRLLKPTYDLASREYRLVDVISRRVDGLSLAQVAEKSGLTVEYLRSNWIK